jgi:ComF family protein
MSLVIETVSLHWRSYWDQFLALVLPPRCVGCRRLGVSLCPECISRFPRVEAPFCARCGGTAATDGLCARCSTLPLQIDCIRSVVYFEGTLREVVHLFKYNDRTILAEPMGDLMAAYWKQNPMEVDVVVPVPLHAARLRERGYNQAALLAHEMARRVGLAVDDGVLIRQRATASQIDLDVRQRRENVRAAFRCSSDRLAGKRVLLVDDVCTTGATLEACSVALSEGGARSVQALTLARAR